MGTIKNH